MKKFTVVVILFILNPNIGKACAWYDADFEYFNLFTQEIIQNKEYEPFLLTYSNAFYNSESYHHGGFLQTFQPDENIEAWQKYFKNTLTYDETNALVKIIHIKHLNNIKKGTLTHELFKKLGKNFYTNFQEGLDYLIEAKYLEPYMSFSDFTYYKNGDYQNEITIKSASSLDYNKTHKALISLYIAAKNKEIKLRYAYQIIRFNHYTKHYKEAVSAFDTYVKPIQLDTPIYWYALDQKAGALRGLGRKDEANWDFFQVFIHSRNKKQSAYLSMFFLEESNFETLLNKAKTTEEKNIAYFLLAYNGFANPVPIMEKMLANNAKSDVLKVLTARAINSIERDYLPYTIYCSSKEDCEKYGNRLPIANSYDEDEHEENHDFIHELEAVVKKAKSKSNEEFWHISDAYIKFLKKDYAQSLQILNNIQTKNDVYIAEIEKMKMLNDILSQPTITAAYEEVMMQKYSEFFNQENATKKYKYESIPDTQNFIYDILANRYLLQGELGKSFLMTNFLSDLQYNPNVELTKQLEAFYKKPNKTSFEKIIAKNLNDVGNTTAFFNVIYGDKAMREANFSLAKSHYEKAQNFSGIPRTMYDYESDSNEQVKHVYKNNEYDGFRNISSTIFGHNELECYECGSDITMKAEDLSYFPFLKNYMNKLQLADALLVLERVGKGNDYKAAKANQLIGNLLYNTSVLGFYRETFVMDVNNANSPKFQFWNRESTIGNFYFKNYNWNSFIEPDNFDFALQYYQKALNSSQDNEQKARILFQMASAEQGKYYQWETNYEFEDLDYNDPNREQKVADREKIWDKTKNLKYRSYFTMLKKNYSTTQTYLELKGQCSYFNYFVSK